jgi:hypothetical protein
MAPAYNPIIRTFCRFRAVLVDSLGVDRRLVHPRTPLDVLIPAARRAEALERLREAWLRAPALERRIQQYPLCGVVAVAVSLVGIVSMALQSWLVFLAALPLLFGLVVLAFRVRRTRVVPVPLGPRTVGEMVIFLTRFGEHPGYRFSRNEIALKVRLVVAGSVGVPVDQVGEETSFVSDLSG